MTAGKNTGARARAAGVSFVLFGTLLALFTGLARAQSDRGFIDKRLGEEEQIRLRNEWFFSSRRAGTSSDQELWSLRLAAVEETRRQLVEQLVRRTMGFESEQNIWVSKGPSPSEFGGWAFGNVAGRVQAIEVDWATGTLYVGGAAGGVWKSTNDGLSYTSIFDSAGTLAVGAIRVDPNDSNTIWVGTGDNIMGCESYFGIGLMRSTNGGGSWELRNGSGGTLNDLSSFGGISIDPRDSNRIVVGGKYRGCADGNQQSGALYTSDDGGESWTLRLSNTQVHEIARDPDVPDILWIASDRGVFKSIDNGEGWTLQTNSGLPNGNLGRTELAIAPSDPDTVYVLFDSPGDQFWRTTDGGATWSLMNSDACDGQCWYNMVIRVHSTNPDVIYRGTVQLFKSTNGGIDWTQLTNGWGASQQVHQDIQSMLVHPLVGDTAYIGSDGGLWKTADGGATFTNLNSNLSVTQFYAIGVDASDPEVMCGGAQDNSSLARVNDDVWHLQAVTGDGFICHINPVDPDYAYITSYPSGGLPNVWRSTGGLFGNFSDITGPTSGVNAGDRIAWVTPYILDPTSPETLYLGTHRAYRSIDHGSSWTQVGPNDLTAGGNNVLTALEVNRGFPSNVFSGGSGGMVWHSANHGTDWTNITTGLPGRSINDIGADPTNPDRAFAAVGGFNTAHVWEWNRGAGWVARDGGLPNVPANSVLMLTDTDILVGMDTGVFRSTDGGETFLPYMAGMAEGMVVTDLKLNELQNMVTAGTYGRGAWQVAVGEIEPILLPDSVELPLIEIDGDSDAKIEPGETWSVRPILRNAGGLTAQDVTARLSSPTEGVTILSPGPGNFGDLAPGESAPVATAFQFAVDPSFECATEVSFDLIDISSPTPPGDYADRPGIYTTTVQGGNEDPIVAPLMTEDFDPDPDHYWSHDPVDPDISGCAGLPYVDEWHLTTKDEEHGLSYHVGNGPGSVYSLNNYAWLHVGSVDSQNGVGVWLPGEADAVMLTVVHWYETAFGEDGGQVVMDFVDDNLDMYATLNPVGDYPGTLGTGFCNGLEGQDAFTGSSGGWVTSLFDLTQYKGRRVWLAFVFGSDRRLTSGEGWYIDELIVEFQTPGPAICDVSRWPGIVSTASFNLIDPGTIEATWDDACSIGEFPEQTYSIQAGDLDALVGTSTYSHAPVDGSCDATSSSTFAFGPGNEYYVIVPVGDGREGGAGPDSSGVERPQPGTTCGLQRVSCP